MSSAGHRESGTQEMLGKQLLDLLANATGSWNADSGFSLSLSGSTLEQTPSPESPERYSPVRQDALCNLTHQHEEQHKGQDPAQVVPREVEPRAVVDVYLGALTAPSCKERQEDREAW